MPLLALLFLSISCVLCIELPTIGGPLSANSSSVVTYIGNGVCMYHVAVVCILRAVL